ncbi:MAG: hypothetical protein IPJ19_21020 [Planctomycetes bacterium]|nr:hypothetical protein [Planctomycetota bacterium]
MSVRSAALWRTHRERHAALLCTVYYRDATVLGGCAATSTFNSTNAFDVSWQ